MQPLILLLLIAPGAVAARGYQRIAKKQLRVLDFLCQTAEFSLMILIINYIILVQRGWNENPFQLITVLFVVKYGLLSLLCAYILPYIYQWICYLIGRYITGSIPAGK